MRGEGPAATLYLDLACPACAAVWAEIRDLPLRLCVRHFPIASRRPRAPFLHAACEAAAAQDRGSFWGMWDSLLADRGHVDDPHLWERAERLGLDLDRFERDRRSERAAARVRSDLEGAIRAGVASVPAAFVDGVQIRGDVGAELASTARAAAA